MTYSLHKSQIRTIRQGDPKFVINDGLVITPRAGFNISQGCPKEYRMIILECMNNGWLTPVAHIAEREYILLGLSSD